MSEVLSNQHSKKWKEVFGIPVLNLENDTWNLVELPKGRGAI